MNIKNHIIYTLLLVFGLGVTLTACSSDNDTINEWSVPYVFLQSHNYMKVDSYFTLDHGANGIEGEPITIKFKVKTQKKAQNDIKVKLSALSDDFEATAVEFSIPEPIILKGEKETEEIIAEVKDLNVFNTTNDEAKYSFKIVIEEIGLSSCDAKISELQNNIEVHILKYQYSNVKAKKPEVGFLIKDRSDWKIELEAGVENEGENIIDGNKRTDIARDSKGFWFSIDLQKELTISAIQTSFWDSYYAASLVEVYVSDNGSQWISQGQIRVGGKVQTVSFNSPINTRYIKYQIIGIGMYKRTCLTEVDLYEVTD